MLRCSPPPTVTTVQETLDSNIRVVCGLPSWHVARTAPQPVIALSVCLLGALQRLPSFQTKPAGTLNGFSLSAVLFPRSPSHGRHPAVRGFGGN